MIKIKDLLLRFNNILLTEEAKIDSVREIISEVINVPIQKEDVKIKNNIIYLNIKPIYKSEIFIKKDKIFSMLKKSFGERSPTSFQ